MTILLFHHVVFPARYIQCIHQKLYHLTPVEYEEFVSIVLSARTAFLLTPEGNTQFKEWLASLRRYFDNKHNFFSELCVVAIEDCFKRAGYNVNASS